MDEVELDYSFFELKGDNGQTYCIAGIDRSEVMQLTGGGTHPGEWFNHCAGEVKKFSSCRELSAKEVLGDYMKKNYFVNSHYVERAGKIFYATQTKVLIAYVFIHFILNNYPSSANFSRISQKILDEAYQTTLFGKVFWIGVASSEPLHKPLPAMPK